MQVTIPSLLMTVHVHSPEAVPDAASLLHRHQCPEPGCQRHIIATIIIDMRVSPLCRQCQMLHRLCIGTNAQNLGAGGTRSALLDSSAADYVIFFDDDVEPTPGCVDAYVRTFRANPQAAAFNGERSPFAQMDWKGACSLLVGEPRG